MIAQSVDLIPPPRNWRRSLGKWLGFHNAEDVAAPDQIRVAPTLITPLPSGENVVWCGTLQLAWNEGGECFGGKIELDPPSPLADALNRERFDRRCVDEESIFVASGALDAGIVQRIKAYLRKVGAPESRVLGADGLGSALGEFICYARLDKKLKFPKPFGRLGFRPICGKKVPCFGYLKYSRNADDSRKQTLIHHYQTPGDFVVELKTEDEGDMLVLAKTAPGATLREVVSAVIGQLQSAPIFASGKDELVVPCITLSSLEHFAELAGRKIVGSPGWFIKSAMQAIDFKMDEKGVLLWSEAQISFARCLAPVAQHVMILEPPFLLLMKRRNAEEPYFVAWISNGDLLRRGS